MRCRTLAAAMLLLSIAAPSPARDIFVDNVAGDDSARGREAVSTSRRTGPVRSIAKALRLAEKSDRIVLAATGEPYHESISLSSGRHSGYEGKPFVIDGGGAILDGSAEVPGRAWEHFERDIFRFQPRHLTYQQLYMDFKPAVRRFPDPAARRLPALEPLEWMMFNGAIYFRPEENKLPRDYPLRYAAQQTGITLYHVRHVRIENLIVQGFHLDGVNAHDGVNDCLLDGLTCRGNGRSGISVGGSSRVRIENCRIGDNGVVQLRTEGQSITRLTSTELIDNTGPAYAVEGNSRLFIDGQLIESDVR